MTLHKRRTTAPHTERRRVPRKQSSPAPTIRFRPTENRETCRRSTCSRPAEVRAIMGRISERSLALLPLLTTGIAAGCSGDGKGALGADGGAVGGRGGASGSVPAV